MIQIEIKENEAGQRLDKFLHKFLPLAPSSFFYKMLRKKNITLNEKKAEGKEKLEKGDRIAFFLSEETLLKFKENTGAAADAFEEYDRAYRSLKGIQVVYEDEHAVIMNKPANVLSQKAEAGDLSVNEWLIGYLLHAGKLQPKDLETYKPAVCNRLDRNTGGLIIGACSLYGSQELNRLIKERSLRKFYRMIVKGRIVKAQELQGYLLKNEDTNRVRILQKKREGAVPVCLRLHPIAYGSLPQEADKAVGAEVELTLAEAELITGKPHQIRAQLAELGHPLLGDYKYGDKALNDKCRRAYNVRSQLLHACRLEFPKLAPPFEKLSEKVIEIDCPEVFDRIIPAGNEEQQSLYRFMSGK